MCGICGFVGFKDKDLIQEMTSRLTHRGPDDHGFYLGDDICLGHRRLSIIDLKTGHQPMFNEDKSLCVVCNGEIYNYKAIRDILKKKGHYFSTNSDTEVILHSYEEFGEDFIKQFNGMFAFALWDNKERKLILARDRLGIKPLYYYKEGNKFYFSSEVKSLLLTGMSKEIDFTSLDHYLSFRYTPYERTMFKSVSKLDPASMLVYKDSKISINKYWSLEYKKENISKKQAADKFYSLLEDSVRLRLMSDVPLGVYLSGGVDSSAITSLMSKFASGAVKTFSIGFGTDIDEVNRARQISNLLGSEHTELFVEKEDFNLLHQIVWNMDDPLGDAIIIPTYLLSKKTSKKVKVVLTGEGADEILAGYIHHKAMNLINKYNSHTPAFLKKAIITCLRKTPSGLIDRFFPYPSKLGQKGKSKLINYLETLNSDCNSYKELVSLFSEDEKRLLCTDEFYNSSDRIGSPICFNETIDGFLDRIIDLDMNNWLVNYTLFKQDKLTMANSLEARVPYLDHRIVEFCASLPDNFKFNQFKDKYILRKSSSRFLPHSVSYAKKKAFYFPIEKCFDDRFNVFVKDILNESSVKKRGILSWDYVKTLLSGVESLELIDNKRVMALLILEIWFREFIDK